MHQKYIVYIAGKPLVFGNVTLIGKQACGTIIEVGDNRTMHLLIEAMNAEKHPEGATVLAVNGFDPWAYFQAAHKFVQAAGGLVTDEAGRLLAIRRMGKWDLPKGKVEKGEAIDAAALREVEEECGLKKLTLVRPVTSTWHTYERKGQQHLKRTDWFLMRASATEPLIAQAEEDIEEVKWLDTAGLRDMERDTYQSLLPVLEAWKKLD